MGPRINLMPHHTRVVTAATLSPVTVAECKTYLREVDSYDDALIADAIAQATAELQSATRRAFINTTFEDLYDEWPLDEGYSAVVHRNPLVSVSSIAYVDSNGATQTWAAANYVADTYSEPGRICLADNASLPTIDDVNNSVAIRYVAGYGATQATVPVLAKHYIYLWVSAAHGRRPLMDEEIRSLKSLEMALCYGL